MDKQDTTFVDKALEDKAFADQLMGDKALADELIAALIADESLGDVDLVQLVKALFEKKGILQEGMVGLAKRANHNDDLFAFKTLVWAVQASTMQFPKPFAEDIRSPVSGVYVFTDRNCQGKHAGFGGGRHDMADIARQIGNDAISSLSIAKGWGITLFTGAGFSGDKTTIAPRRDGVGGDRYNLTDGFDNAVSSFVITGVPRDPSRKNQVTSTYHGSATGYTPAEGQKGYSD